MTSRFNKKKDTRRSVGPKTMVTALFCLSARSARAAFVKNGPVSTSHGFRSLARAKLQAGAVVPSTTSSLSTMGKSASALIRSMSATAGSDTATGTDYDALNKERGLDKYDPSSFESEIYDWWEQSGCFKPDAKQAPNGKEAYVLPMPPPNVTGRLHMGHVLFVALQDILARFHRMRGRPVLWLPGTDHAGIATQLQVEKQLIAEGKTREEVGREEFLEKVWEYKEEQGGHITRQLRSLGASADWSRERFTMDQDLSEAVSEAFVRLHEKGLVYRGEYMVNWAPLLKTAVSDLEVEYTEEEGRLFYFKYMVEGSEGKYRTVVGRSVGFPHVQRSHFSSRPLVIHRVSPGGNDSTGDYFRRYCCLCSSRRRAIQTSVGQASYGPYGRWKNSSNYR